MTRTPALYIGRFQPFHLGHFDALTQIFAREEKVIIAVGSSQYSGTDTNPFSFEERAACITAALANPPQFAGRYQIIPLPDIHDDAAWVPYVEKIIQEQCGNFGTVYTGSPLTKALFSQYSSHLVQDLHKNIGVSGTEVRLKMRSGGEWQHFVPSSTIDLLTQRKI